MKQASCWTEMTYQDCRDVVAPHWSVLLVIGHSVRPAEPLTRHTCCTASAPWQTSRHLLHTQRVRIRADDDHAVDDLIADRQLHAIGARPRCSAPPPTTTGLRRHRRRGIRIRCCSARAPSSTAGTTSATASSPTSTATRAGRRKRQRLEVAIDPLHDGDVSGERACAVGARDLQLGWAARDLANIKTHGRRILNVRR